MVSKNLSTNRKNIRTIKVEYHELKAEETMCVTVVSEKRLQAVGVLEYLIMWLTDESQIQRNTFLRC